MFIRSKFENAIPQNIPKNMIHVFEIEKSRDAMPGFEYPCITTFVFMDGRCSKWVYENEESRDLEYEWIMSVSVIGCKVNGPEKVPSKPPDPYVRPTDY